MILDIAHLIVSSRDFSRQIRVFEGLGYRLEFWDKDLRNPHIKKPLMAEFCERYDLAFLSYAPNIAIELVDYGHANSASPYILPILEKSPHIFNNPDIPVLNRDYSGCGNFRFNSLVIKVRNMENSVRFWEFFGFKTIEAKDWNRTLEFYSPLKNTVRHIHLEVARDGGGNRFLDDNGSIALAFVSSSLERDKSDLDKEGLIVTDIEKTIVGGREIELFFVKGASGEFVEVFSVKK
jgi:hypothetical protein